MEPGELTRRGWLLHLGSGIALSGLSGTDLDAAEKAKLPPGLYEPSIDHLAHVLKPVPAGAPQQPLFFTGAEYQQIRKLVASMLGEEPEKPPVPDIASWIDLIVYDSAAVRQAAQSLSPEHRALAAGFYGEDAVRELETFDAQQICRAGLSRLNADSPLNLEDPFIRWLKHRVIEGFYTSQAGLQELDYKGNSFYSACPGCDR